ncbi:MAG TPA: DEAD/DEAH box helicase, partial [Steroidobacteraceae bacterium]|nr:DEAD/DEAH box helicase [Steroidobacteraceae bacterium]
MGDGKPVTALRGVGARQAERLRALGVETTQDLLFLLPLRYEDRTHVVPLGELQPGQRAVVEGEVLLTEIAFRGRRQMLSRIGDGSGFLTLRFFHFSAQQQESLARGLRIRCFGDVRRGPKGLEIVHPEYRRVDPASAALDEHLTPIYPATEGLTQGRLRQLVGLALDQTVAGELEDWLPPAVLADSRLPPLREALHYVHRPPADAPVDQLMDRRHPAQRRLAFEELLAHHLSLKLLRARVQHDPGWPLAGAGALKASLIAALPFRPTGAQTRVLGEIESDLKLGKPMLRLIQGDVGCGKTLVAALAATHAIENGRQVALMAPTELLADQHAQNFRRWFDPLGVTLALLTGRLTGKARDTALANIREGAASIVIGTHALFQEGVAFATLALAIVDE